MHRIWASALTGLLVAALLCACSRTASAVADADPLINQIAKRLQNTHDFSDLRLTSPELKEVHEYKSELNGIPEVNRTATQKLQIRRLNGLETIASDLTKERDSVNNVANVNIAAYALKTANTTVWSRGQPTLEKSIARTVDTTVDSIIRGTVCDWIPDQLNQIEKNQLNVASLPTSFTNAVEIQVQEQGQRYVQQAANTLIISIAGAALGAPQETVTQFVRYYIDVDNAAVDVTSDINTIENGLNGVVSSGVRGQPAITYAWLYYTKSCVDLPSLAGK